MSRPKSQLGKFFRFTTGVPWIHFIDNQSHLLPCSPQSFGYVRIQDMQSLFAIDYQKNPLGGCDGQIRFTLNCLLQAGAVLQSKPTRIN